MTATKVTTLEKLAIAIKNEHEEVLQSAQTTLEHARKAGKLLLKVKEQVGHGNFQEWVDANLGFSIRTAQSYMKIAKSWEELRSKTQDLAFLGLEAALKLISKPKADSKHLPPPKKRPDETEHIEAFPRPTFEIVNQTASTSRIEATEEEGDQYALLSINPAVPPNEMTDQEVTDFRNGLLQAVRRLEMLTNDSIKIPPGHGLVEEITALVNQGEEALATIKEQLTHV